MKLILFIQMGLLVVPAVIAEQNQKNDTSVSKFLDMPLQEMLKLKVSVPGALTKLSLIETPASITEITAEDIKLTPARNILDLIEIYVPGAIWMNYEDGPQLGMRGIIANRNVKYLLRINGRVMNNKAHYGVKSELEQWDLSDIQRIEIVRGSGSVIYGPGAIAGVINIFTYDAKSMEEGLQITGRYVSEYDSKGLTISHGFKSENFSVFSFASITQTSGYAAKHFLGTNNGEVGYVGTDILLDDTPLDYYADFEDTPQIKLHIDLEFLDHWRFWSRYTQQGSNWKGNEVKTHFSSGLLNQAGVKDRQWTNTLEYNKPLSNTVSISSMLSMDSSDVERRRDRADHPDPDHPLNKEINFSETELFFRFITNWQVTDKVEIALGTEYSLDLFRPGWGDSKNELRIGERGHIINGPTSDALETGSKGSADRFGNELFVGDGWNTNTYSLFAEANVSLTPRTKVLLSARTDKSTYSNTLFSPRVVFIASINKDHEMKIIAQKAERMDTAGQLYALNQSNNNTEAETLSGAEVIYSAFTNKPLSFTVSAFRNNAEVIAWDNSIQSTNLVGDLKVYGIEPVMSYKWDEGEINLSYSLVKQQDWTLAEGVPASGISYSDFNQPLAGSAAIQLGEGNDLNNWPNQALKFYTRIKLTDKLSLHFDARFLWDYQGSKDGLVGLNNAVQGHPEEAAVESALANIDNVGAYDEDLRINASISYDFNKALSLQLFVQNLLSKGGNKRYSYDFSGNNFAAPSRVRFIEEPKTIEINISYKF